MQEEKRSATAWRVALARAAHQIFDTPKVFDDPLALRIVGAYSHGNTPESFFHDRYKFTRRARFLRALLVVRSRLAEEELAAAFERGVRQYVLLGAGLDTFAYRNQHPDLSVFEVDHPATQAWKRKILQRAGISEPDSLTFVPVNFERQTAMDGLVAAGFDRSSPAFFAWLGVTMYLQEGVVNRRLRRIIEPWVTFLSPQTLIPNLQSMGFREIRDLGSDDMNTRYLGGRTDSLKMSPVGPVMIASV